MPDTSPNLALPYLLASQAQKHVTHNEALQRLDALVQLNVKAFDVTTPPPLPEDGEMHSLGAAPTGTWAGQAGNLALFSAGNWTFIPPQEGWRAWGIAESILQVYSGGTWLPIVPSQNLDGIGIGTTWDATNRLAVASDAAIFSHAGDDHRLKVNKASSGDTGSLLFQSNWSGRAEIGLVGDNDFSLKVSDDGSTFTEGLRVRASDGVNLAPCLMSKKVTISDDDVAYIDTPSAGGIVLVSLVDSTYPQTTHSGIFAYDCGATLSLLTFNSGSNINNLGASVLTGTTGVDTKTSISVQSGQILIENRHGGTRYFALTFINAV